MLPFNGISMISKTDGKPQLGILPSSILIPQSIRITTKDEQEVRNTPEVPPTQNFFSIFLLILRVYKKLIN